MKNAVGQPELLKELNRERILRILQHERVISRPVIAQQTGLSRATVAMVTEELLAQNLVREVGLGNSTGGRPPVMLEFNPDAAYALGARLYDRNWGIVITNLDGQVKRRLDVPVQDMSPEAAVSALTEGVRALLSDFAAHRILPAIGLGTPGLVDSESGKIITAVDVGWRDVPMKAMVEEALQLPAFVANRSKVGALAELWYGAGRGLQHLIYISIGTGIAAGIILDGELFTGANSSAGELGHVTILPDGPLCPCGNRGCLQQLASGPAIAAQARERLRLRPESQLNELAGQHPEWITASTVFQAAEAGDTLAVEIVQETAGYLGIAVASLINLFNPQLIVLGGPVGRAGGILLEPLTREVQRRAMAHPLSTVRITVSTLGPDAGAIGAAALVLQRASTLLFNGG
ncbi:MAG: ROK family transcriptional regulator [Anaerolineae bacterium]